ncbi:MAG TPA: CPBP family intramembrane glutamic endopeptidase [Candidatus Bathyarchaeia archaeon]|nr:CPBP family intramembrane glutamic endopeptidase [Candidatus Bathyarchaeia archaeon]
MGKKSLVLCLSFFYLLIVWGVYRFYTDFSEPWDELVFKPLLWLGMIIFLVLRLEKRKLRSLGIVFKKPLKNIFLGLGVGILITSQYLFALAIKGGRIMFNPQNLKLTNLFLYFFVCLSTAAVEEITFRGFFMTRINEIIKNKLNANIMAGLIFFLIHLPILLLDYQLGLRGIGEYFILSLGLGIIDGYVFWKTKGVLAPIASHFFLNYLNLFLG